MPISIIPDGSLVQSPEPPHPTKTKTARSSLKLFQLKTLVVEGIGYRELLQQPINNRELLQQLRYCIDVAVEHREFAPATHSKLRELLYNCGTGPGSYRGIGHMELVIAATHSNCSFNNTGKPGSYSCCRHLLYNRGNRAQGIAHSTPFVVGRIPCRLCKLYTYLLHTLLVLASPAVL